MSTALADYTVPYFATWGNTPDGSTVPIYSRGPTIRVNNRDAQGPPVLMPGIVGTVSPKLDADLDVTEAAGRKREGHIEVTTQTRLQMDNEATSQPSWLVFYKGFWYFLEEQDDWDVAKGYVYRATRDRRESNV
jgi:hypothetical protein